MGSFSIVPRGPYDLAAARDFAGGFAPGLGGHATGSSTTSLLMAFPVEGWQHSAALDVWQDDAGLIHAQVDGSADIESVRAQVARSLSLDHDGSGWPEVGRRDPVIGALQSEQRMLRPVCFYSAYEAVTSFVIGQRIGMRQSAKVKRWLADEVGDAIEHGGHTVHAFPRPQRLLELEMVPGISAEKVRRLHGLAQAALDGRLDTAALRALPERDALAQLRELPGVGPWTAQAVLMRGCGTADTLPLDDTISRAAVHSLYGLAESPDDEAWLAIAERWRPYRMWATVLLHLSWRRRQETPPSYRQVRTA